MAPTDSKFSLNSTNVDHCKNALNQSMFSRGGIIPNYQFQAAMDFTEEENNQKKEILTKKLATHQITLQDLPSNEVLDSKQALLQSQMKKLDKKIKAIDKILKGAEDVRDFEEERRKS